ncbi:MAG: zinc-dependent alcohol dehydrogenase [Acidimicrobiales bacterium]
MKALVFGAPPDGAEARPSPTDEVDELLADIPFGLHDVEEPVLYGPEWVLTRPLLAGVCGSESKLVLGDFGEGDLDNPMAAFSSLPHVPRHEVLAEVVAAGPAVDDLMIGQRVILNPWLTCRARGVDPQCPACAVGDLNLCWSFTVGDLGPGLHVGVTAAAPGGWAERMAAHRSMLLPVPDAVPDEAAVLADPFAVSLHAVLRHPPPPGGRAVVYGAGALGLTTVAILAARHPDVEVAVVARFPHQGRCAEGFGASRVVAHEPRRELVEALAAWSGGVLHQPLTGLPTTHPGHVDVVYDTVGKAETLEVAVRVLASWGTLVVTGVAAPERWESTPVYFKELSVVGSNAFGIEELDDVRQHALAHYLDLVVAGRIDLRPMLTHRYPLTGWWEAMRALARPGESGALKVAFTPGSTE